MKKILPLLLLGCAASAFASNAERDVLRQALNVAARSVKAHDVSPVVIASETAGGGEKFGGQWIVNRRGNVTGTALAEAYEKANREPHALSAIFPDASLVEVEGARTGQIDWDKIEAQRPGTKSILVFAYPAVDDLAGVALVRADLFTKGAAPTTQFWDAERQPDGAWKIEHGAIGTYAAFHAR